MFAGSGPDPAGAVSGADTPGAPTSPNQPGVRRSVPTLSDGPAEFKGRDPPLLTSLSIYGPGDLNLGTLFSTPQHFDSFHE